MSTQLQGLNQKQTHNVQVINMKNKYIQKIALSAMLIAVGLLLPFLTGQLQQFGNMLLPMHIPVMLCGLICGQWYGLGIGFILPIMRSILFGMPVFYPNAVSMAFELAAYGFIIGYLFSHAKWQCIRSLYRCLIISMLGGRAVWGIVQALLALINGGVFTPEAFITYAFLNAFPGIIIQLILIPSIMLALHKTHLVHFGKNNRKEIKTDAE